MTHLKRFAVGALVRLALGSAIHFSPNIFDPADGICLTILILLIGAAFLTETYLIGKGVTK